MKYKKAKTEITKYFRNDYVGSILEKKWKNKIKTKEKQ